MLVHLKARKENHIVYFQTTEFSEQLESMIRLAKFRTAFNLIGDNRII